MDFFKILAPIEWVVAWIMYLAHSALTALGLDPASGAAWGLSIVGLVIVIRILLIPLFFKQIRASRGMQLLAPEMQAIQKKYKGKTDPASREAMSRETMELYRRHGTNPFASCLPILAQSPIFFALFRVLNSLDEIGAGTQPAIGPIGREVAAQAERSTILGAPLSSTFMQAAAEGGAAGSTRIVTVLLIIAMSATTFLTQRQLTMKNMPPAALQGPMAQQQKVLLYVLPLIFAFSGVNFPIGVLLYWTTTNIWSMGQQFYTIRRMPAPGSEAERIMKERKERKARARGENPDAGTGSLVIEAPQPKGQRQQPVRKQRAKTKPPQAGGAQPGGAQSGGPQGGGTSSGGTGAGHPGAAEGTSGSVGGGASGASSAAGGRGKRDAGGGSKRDAGSGSKRRPAPRSDPGESTTTPSAGAAPGAAGPGSDAAGAPGAGTPAPSATDADQAKPSTTSTRKPRK
ncbi:membrane protein insertase YidC [Cellulomonas fimi]|uniref:Membrane protein insertase YidC n=1 Tax=Cellulomonas fimi TaxID=1708 RepID=A0A7Y0LZS5_CELFI|nr:membrane protein insertase YidC [Cellulomonas fimi]NMR20428.1 membrane protein insertase YidC [Cellulomonas fimi]